MTEVEMLTCSAQDACYRWVPWDPPWGFGVSRPALAGVLAALWPPPDSIALSSASNVTTFVIGPDEWDSTDAGYRTHLLFCLACLMASAWDWEQTGVSLGSSMGLSHCSWFLCAVPPHSGLELCLCSEANWVSFWSSMRQHQTIWDLAWIDR